MMQDVNVGISRVSFSLSCFLFSSYPLLCRVAFCPAKLSRPTTPGAHQNEITTAPFGVLPCFLNGLVPPPPASKLDQDLQARRNRILSSGARRKSPDAGQGVASGAGAVVRADGGGEEGHGLCGLGSDGVSVVIVVVVAGAVVVVFSSSSSFLDAVVRPPCLFLRHCILFIAFVFGGLAFGSMSTLLPGKKHNIKLEGSPDEWTDA